MVPQQQSNLDILNIELEVIFVDYLRFPKKNRTKRPGSCIRSSKIM